MQAARALGHEGGYSEAWEDPEEAEKYKCPVCLEVPRDAMTHVCGELFCERCWLQWLGQDDRCPVCRQAAGDVCPAHRERRHILNLNIKCELCGGVDRLGDKQKHAQEQCPYRNVECPECKQDVPFKELDDHKKTQCPYRPVACPDCGAATTHQGLEEHRTTTCKFRLTTCQLCSKQVRIQDMEKHFEENAGVHIAALLQEISDLKNEVKMLKANGASSAPAAGASVTWHSGIIRPKPNGISRKNNTDLRFSEGFSFDHFRCGWAPGSNLDNVYRDSTWSCCGKAWSSEPCQARPAAEVPPSPASNVDVQQWAITSVLSTVAEVKDQCGLMWNDRMAQYCGKVGKVKRVESDGTAEVEFRLDGRKQSWWYPVGALRDGKPIFAVGTSARVYSHVKWLADQAELPGNGGWVSRMEAYCGKVGTIASCGGLIGLKFEGGQSWHYPPHVLQPCAPDDPVAPVIKVGASVKINADVNWVERQVDESESLIWSSDMAAHCGRIGTIESISEEEDMITVLLEGNNFVCPSSVLQQPSAAPTALQVGASVTIPADRAWVEAQFEGSSFTFTTSKASCCGKAGKISRIDTDDNTIEVRFDEDGRTWWWPRSVLEANPTGSISRAPLTGLQVGASVTIPEDAAWVEAQFEGSRTVTFYSSTAALCGKAGKIVQIDASDNTINVEFDDGNTKWFPRSVIEAGLAGFELGASVKVNEDAAWVQTQFPNSGCGWVDSMAPYCGKVGKIAILEATRAKVEFDDDFWWYPRSVLQLCSGGAASSSAPAMVSSHSQSSDGSSDSD